jgi:hypothetical protein
MCPAVSKQQQQFMGIVHAIQKGEMKPSEATPAARAAAKSMKKKDVEDFAATKHKGLPEEVPENEGINEIKSDKDIIKDGLKYAKKKYKYTAKQMKELAKDMLQHIRSGEIDDQASMEAYIDFYNDGMMEGSFKGSIAQDARGLGLKTLSDLTKITDRKKIQKIQNDFVKFSMTNKNKYKDWYTAWKAFWGQSKLKEIIRSVVKEILENK